MRPNTVWEIQASDGAVVGYHLEDVESPEMISLYWSDRPRHDEVARAMKSRALAAFAGCGAVEARVVAHPASCMVHPDLRKVFPGLRGSSDPR